MLIDGKKVSQERLANLKGEIKDSGLSPGLATVIVGEDPASQMYVRMKHKACDEVGIRSIGVVLKEDVTTDEVIAHVKSLNVDASVDGILVQLPLPGHIDTEAVIESVSPQKDVDGFHPENIGALFSGRPAFVPCTPGGIMTLLEEYSIEPKGLNAVVIGRSVDVGRPMAALLLNADATVTICHSKTKNLAEEVRRADLIVSAIGRARFITKDMVSPGAVVIDVGINQDENGKLCGDVDFDTVSTIASAITPVPGGVGPMTIATLMENTFKAAKNHLC
ncbi:bifunctional methylenetetrahydrofolate dehydrogenase/methenyltetrahydrofolate cyclohydrolase FolD [Methanogenium sp. S4BF]|uniref:bifunctional methylenetetrahydrofolate dehydrogenase/methenyltetrahydrofolate cyclohydrolase FolD n=1 Tax=Methanogenium sp. S4BF TaxID=1789226 RepID=UPI002416DA28|nr:bifunctional methylenetetrahydrofolate dehydrogenase/methenyltetrahydrofolate cyclohydrolase FolD [Methanogenium sp. S4BF]WFN35427.1 bifunctional methylenetetrahydrofolate dehydrogenase/methenyltetrahydrofolate cyclohydrolase FolD [Methanogenium sp. S4BF]